MRLISLRGKRVFWGAVAILFLVLIVLTIIAFTPANNTIIKNIIPTPTVNLCSSFSKDPREISCEEAKTIATKRFPGAVRRIRKDAELVPTEKSLKPKMAEKKLWLILVHLDKPQESPVFSNGEKRLYPDIEVGTERTTGKIIFSRNI